MSIIRETGIAMAFAAAVAGTPYGAGYAQAKLAPEATDQHLATLQQDCERGHSLHDVATCLTIKGIELARN
jgi:hypothetical protein